MMVATQDSCVADEAKINCIIRDMTNSLAQTKFNINLPASKSCRDLVEEVAKKLGYQSDSFTLSYEKSESDELIEVSSECFLEQAISSVCTNNNKRKNFSVLDKDGVSPVRVTSKETEATASPATTDNKDIYSSSNNINSWSNTYSSGYSYSSALMKSDTGYVGLVNQAMTCYLNSLLQTLYMTPEFRNAVYRWAFDGGSTVKSIPYQLQRLFLQLQTSTRRAIETTDITKSFGWDSSEAWQQHDVQELMRVMFDALEKKWRNTDQRDLINQLYQGKLKDYVKCLQCGHESARTDCYLDIPLTIRAFGSNQIYNSLEESLRAFVQHEQLDGDNQYFCEKCNKKCDAHKGLKFMSFPYLLTLQMKRFDFDYTTMCRIKLNDKMTFPEILNLNHLIDDPGTSCDSGAPAVKDEGGGGEANCRSDSGGYGDGIPLDKRDVETGGIQGEVMDHSDGGPGESGVCAAADGSPSAASCPLPSPGTHNCDTADSVDEGADDGCSASGADAAADASSSEAAANDRNTRNSAVKGPYEYELYSIMIHSGSAAGGHYYAYIKSFKDGQWYSFNDQHVSTITYDDITKTYGGSTGTRGYYSATYASSTNAYMLVYRQIDRDRNEDFLGRDEFPKHLQQELYKLQNRDEEERKRRELEKATCKIKMFCLHPVTRKLLEGRLEVHKDTTLKEATEMAWKQFDLEKCVPADCVRLVKYDEFHSYIEKSYEGLDDQCMETVLDGVKSTYMFDLMLETKRPDQSFNHYKIGGVTVKVHLCDLDAETVSGSVSVRGNQDQTVAQLKVQICDELGLTWPPEGMRVIVEKYYGELRVLTDPEALLKSEGFFKTSKVFVECSEQEDDNILVFSDTRLSRLLDRHQNTIKVYVSLPPLVVTTKGTRTSGEREAPVGEDSPSDPEPSNNGCHVNSHPDKAASHSIGGGTSGNTSNSSNISQVTSIVDSARSSPCDSSRQPLTAEAGDPGGDDDKLPTAQPPSSHHQNGPVLAYGGSGEQSSYYHDDSESTVTSSLDSNSTVTSCSTVTPSEPAAGSNDDVDEHALNSDLLSSKVTSVANRQRRSLGDGSEWPSPSVAEEASRATEVSECDVEQQPLLGDSSGEQQTTSSGERGAGSVSSEACEEDEEYRKYCTATLSVDATTKDRSVAFSIDKRMTVKSLKRELEKFVGTTADCFKLYKVYSNNQEFEVTKCSETLSSYGDECRLLVKLGRPLRRGECRVKVYQLCLGQPEHLKLLTEVIIAKGMTVSEVRRLIVTQIKEECDVDIPEDRCRIRKKSWRSPSTIYFDEQRFDGDIPLMSSLELFVEELGEHSQALSSQSDVSVYARRWSPSQHLIGTFQEVILTDTSVAHLKQQLSKLSGIPEENVDFARGKSTFPCEISVLEIHDGLDWNPANADPINTWPMSIIDDGCVLYYRDKDEELEKLSDDRRKELQQKENIRMSKYNSHCSSKYSVYSRKERALKIYTDDTPVKEHGTVSPPTGSQANWSSHITSFRSVSNIASETELD